MFVFCAIPPLLALELACRAVVLFVAGFKWLGFQRTLARVMAAWVLTAFLTCRGLFGDLRLWTVEMLNIAYFTGVIGLACLLGYWLIRRYLRKRGPPHEPEPTPQPRRRGRRVSRP